MSNKNIIFKKRASGHLVLVSRVRGVWRFQVFFSDGQLSSARFASPGAAVQFAKFFISSLSGSKKNNNQQQLF